MNFLNWILLLSKNMPVLQVGADMDGWPLKEKSELINYINIIIIINQHYFGWYVNQEHFYL